jgi:hypothetical protein
MSRLDNDELLEVPFGILDVATTIVINWLLWLFLSNLWYSCNILYRRRRDSSIRICIAILCVIPNLFCCLACTYLLIQRVWPGFANCHLLVVFSTTSLCFGVASITAILFIRTYYIWMRHNWLAYVGVIAVISNFSIGVWLYFAMPIYSQKYSQCWIAYDFTWSIGKFIVDMCTNVTLSVLYLRVLHKIIKEESVADGYRKLYLKLYQQGLLSTFTLIISSITTTILAILELAPDYNPFLYAIDRKYIDISFYDHITNSVCFCLVGINATLITHIVGYQESRNTRSRLEC